MQNGILSFAQVNHSVLCQSLILSLAGQQASFEQSTNQVTVSANYRPGNNHEGANITSRFIQIGFAETTLCFFVICNRDTATVITG
ncbi:MAG: hypothetical protein LBI59_02125 [Candidatus Accumulibacter sp.]|jgi:hypothetical protein|nr:hypothetical protein [Accumulibacter sp.]